MSEHSETIFENLRDYNFDEDKSFQVGLRSILELQKDKPKEEVDVAIEKAKFFYYSKCIQKVDYKEYLQWKAKQELSKTSEDASTLPSAVDTADDVGPEYPKSFQEICELIASGKPIPGIKQIPNKLSEVTPSESTLKPRPKPWEKA
ncbi:hypothetical protein K493DRAFT_57368 [Basidiobolus meristosporus CBS 931.73]|uniref:Uncharacterized protein n=1 Tax=Basidiobolus meristosporus CBS 931.73 TaxID=1314790 RepID=A0A1Y1Z281_9FUNG|nr:hypothetical protein K493DRAFT_57368 [Basidiobolus meristosporus CBS 931.73]|eukprot:ORY04204.1 hypothetical protein K493DRAFT_57368 [Basidiobolus meristosporus CBS 931.73]